SCRARGRSRAPERASGETLEPVTQRRYTGPPRLDCHRGLRALLSLHPGVSPVNDLREVVELVFTAHDQPLGPYLVVQRFHRHDDANSVAAWSQVDDGELLVWVDTRNEVDQGTVANALCWQQLRECLLRLRLQRHPVPFHD